MWSGFLYNSLHVPSIYLYVVGFFFFLLDMFIQHTAFLLSKGSQDRCRGILPPAVPSMSPETGNDVLILHLESCWVFFMAGDYE